MLDGYCPIGTNFFLLFRQEMFRETAIAIALQGEHGYQWPFLTREEFRTLMTRKTVRSNFGAGLVNLIGGTEQSREKVANFTKDKDEARCKYMIKPQIFAFTISIFAYFSIK